MPLTRLVYYSTNKLPAAGNISVHLKQILGSAIKNNRHVGVTGGLVFTRNYFMQVLEGERAALTKLFVTISTDPRHEHVELVEWKTAGARFFGAWSMGYAATPQLARDLWSTFNIRGSFDPKKLTGDQLSQLVLELVSKEEGVGFASTQKLSQPEYHEI